MEFILLIKIPGNTCMLKKIKSVLILLSQSSIMTVLKLLKTDLNAVAPVMMNSKTLVSIQLSASVSEMKLMLKNEVKWWIHAKASKHFLNWTIVTLKKRENIKLLNLTIILMKLTVLTWKEIKTWTMKILTSWWLKN